MSLIATCSCGQSFEAQPRLSGKVVKCPSCQGPLKVPGSPSDSRVDLDEGATVEAASSSGLDFISEPLSNPIDDILEMSPAPLNSPSSGSWQRRARRIRWAAILGAGLGAFALSLALTTAAGVALAAMSGKLPSPSPAAADNEPASDGPDELGGVSETEAEQAVRAGKTSSPWRSHRSMFGRYTISMPGPVSRRTGGVGEEFAEALMPDGSGSAVVFCGVVRGQTANDVFEKGKAMFPADNGFVVERPISFQGHPGREYIGAPTTDIGSHHCLRVYHINNRIYCLTWMSSLEYRDSADRFFDSFSVH